MVTVILKEKEKRGIFMKRIVSFVLILLFCMSLLPISAAAATIITRVELSLDYPVAGKTPQTTASINGNGYKIYAIDWYDCTDFRFLEAGEMFQKDHPYRATVWVEAKSGYQFSNVDDNTPAITGYINGEEVYVYKAFEYKAYAMVCLDYYFSSTPEKGWISSVDLTIPAPVAGEMPDYGPYKTNQYGLANVYFGDYTDPNMKNGISWYDTITGDQLTPDGDSFAENTQYTFHCLVFPAEGYKILWDAKVYVNGNQAEAQLDYDSFLSVTYQFPATGSSFHTHFYTDWAWNSGQHYKNCTDCDEVFFVESHKGGVATCQQDGICTVCGYAYIKSDGEHKWSPTYLYQDATGHAWICADCQALSTIEKHNPGPEATVTEPQTCKDCGYIIAPAKNHTHDLTKVPQTPATCTEEGNIEYYFCTGCNDCFTDAEGKNKIPETMRVQIGALGHTVSEKWSCDDQYHWRSCTVCQTVLTETQMLHEEENGKCTTCGYDPSAPDPEETVPSSEEDEENEEKEDEDDKKSNRKTNTKQENDLTWLWIALTVLVAGGTGVLITVLILKKHRKGESL